MALEHEKRGKTRRTMARGRTCERRHESDAEAIAYREIRTAAAREAGGLERAVEQPRLSAPPWPAF
jgi:hypothetical protein